MTKNYSQLLIGLIIGLFAGLLIAKFVFIGNSQSVNQDKITQSDSGKRQNTKEVDQNPAKIGNVPAKVISVLNYIKANNEPMDGYVGGRVFSNREKVLPQRDNQGNEINYQEWDVNPKIDGQNRGAERICTGSDGRSWFTNDHYKTFTEIK